MKYILTLMYQNTQGRFRLYTLVVEGPEIQLVDGLPRIPDELRESWIELAKSENSELADSSNIDVATIEALPLEAPVQAWLIKIDPETGELVDWVITSGETRVALDSMTVPLQGLDPILTGEEIRALAEILREKIALDAEPGTVAVNMILIG